MPPSLTLLGPQRLRPTVAEALTRCLGGAPKKPSSPEFPAASEAPLAVVTAGWQEREEEVDELREHLARPLINLRLHGRTEEVFARHPGLFAAHRDRQDQLKRLQRLYRLRLDPTVAAARELLHRQRPDENDLIEDERQAALEALQTLDAHHRLRLHKIHRDFRRTWGHKLDRATAPHRQEIAEILEGAAALVIAGGHVAVLLNRLRIFRLDRLMKDDEDELRLPVLAWSAGAMALGSQVVLFHDRPPQGAGNAEILDLGLDLYQDLVVFPHARARLRLDDPVRLMLLSRRFAPAVSVPLDESAELYCHSNRWHSPSGARKLTIDGGLATFGAEATDGEPEAPS